MMSGHWTSSTAIHALCLLVPLMVIYITYNVLFHPLRKYPGPFLARITNAYGGYHALRKTLHVQTLLNTRKYGNVYRQAPDKLIFNTAAVVPDILLNPRVVKGTPYDHGRLTIRTSNFVNATDRQVHRRKRRIIGPVLNERSMKIFEPTMSNTVNQFLQLLLRASKDAKPINMSPLSMYLAFDIIGNLAFGFSFKTLTEETWRFLHESLAQTTWRVNTIMQYNILKMPQLLAMLLRPAQITKMKNAMLNIVGTRKQQDKNAIHDFYSVATGEIGEKDDFFEGEMWAESSTFLIAGGQTIPATIAGMFFYLSRYPESCAKLAEEIRTAFTSADEIQSGASLSGCKYLKACIDETLRCNAPVTNMLWRRQDPADNSGKPFVVDGHVIPRGVHVGINLWALFHNEDIFPDAHSFKPERWLEQEGERDEEKAKRDTMRKAFVPFSAGERVCAGRAMAWREINMTIARTLWFFDFENAPGNSGKLGEKMYDGPTGKETVPGFEVRDAFTAEHDGPNLIFHARSEVSNELQAV